MTFRDKVDRVTKQFKERIENKYNVLEMKLFGSAARGDFSKIHRILKQQSHKPRS